ncbi:hypothetical protein H4CHR_02969 [Variovorax sp. PBS-H4]|nr:hypothetical protein H4CHR_02969 [Variovorax sp. PBS-H4]
MKVSEMPPEKEAELRACYGRHWPEVRELLLKLERLRELAQAAKG